MRLNRRGYVLRNASLGDFVAVRTSWSVLRVQYSLLHPYAIGYSLLLLGYKPVQHVTVLNTVGNCNIMVSIIILYYNIIGSPSYMCSVVDRNVVMWRIPISFSLSLSLYIYM